jgi:hypothetical protein
MLGVVLWNRLRVGVHVAFLSVLGFVSEAQAVTQPPPDSTPLPQPVPAPEITVVMSRSFPESAVTLSGLFSFRGESIDATSDAVAVPGVFSPRCDSPLTVEFVLHGGGCALGLAWYNATGSTPASGDLYPVVPQSVTSEMGCAIADFCPLAAAPNAVTSWTPHVYSVENLCDDTRYSGGEIGFALLPNSASPCTAPKYSEYAANLVCTSCTPIAPWVTALIYRSRLRPDGYYLAFEDLPMDPANWRSSSLTYVPDGDFNDFVFHVTGICHGSDNCSAGGSGTGGSSGSSTGGSSTGGSSTGGSSNQGGTTSGGASSGGSNTGGSNTGGSNTGGAAGLGDGGDGTSGSSPGTCVPGREVACTCSDGEDGSQRCADDGQGFGLCDCSDGGDDVRTEGCGCRQKSGSASGTWPLVAAWIFVLRRRRRSANGRRVD